VAYAKGAAGTGGGGGRDKTEKGKHGGQRARRGGSIIIKIATRHSVVHLRLPSARLPVLAQPAASSSCFPQPHLRPPLPLFLLFTKASPLQQCRRLCCHLSLVRPVRRLHHRPRLQPRQRARRICCFSTVRPGWSRCRGARHRVNGDDAAPMTNMAVASATLARRRRGTRKPCRPCCPRRSAGCF